MNSSLSGVLGQYWTKPHEYSLLLRAMQISAPAPNHLVLVAQKTHLERMLRRAGQFRVKFEEFSCRLQYCTRTRHLGSVACSADLTVSKAGLHVRHETVSGVPTDVVFPGWWLTLEDFSTNQRDAQSKQKLLDIRSSGVAVGDRNGTIEHVRLISSSTCQNKDVFGGMDAMYSHDEQFVEVLFADGRQAIFPLGWLSTHATSIADLNQAAERAEQLTSGSNAGLDKIGQVLPLPESCGAIGSNQSAPIETASSRESVSAMPPPHTSDYSRDVRWLQDSVIRESRALSQSETGGGTANTHSGRISAALDRISRSHAAAVPQLWIASDWGRDREQQEESLRWHSLPNVLGSESAAMAWLGDARTLGFSLMSGLPDADGAVADACELFGPVRDTVPYGRTFQVKHQPFAWNMTFNSAGLDPHTDNPYRDPTPSIQLLHCRQSARRGGETTLVDGFAAAETLRLRSPAGFELLSKYPATFEFVKGAGFKQGGMELHAREQQETGGEQTGEGMPGVGRVDRLLRDSAGANGSVASVGEWCRGTAMRDTSCHLFARKRLIETESDGRITGITFNCRTMGPPEVPSHLLDDWMRAYDQFSSICNDPVRALCFQLQPGCMYMVDNRRVLHGRLAFEGPSTDDAGAVGGPDQPASDGSEDPKGGEGVRHVEGCYGDMDALASLHRVLSTQYGDGRK